MMIENKPRLSYSAKNTYRNGSGIETYEKERFSGVSGWYRYHRERKSVAAMINMLPTGVSIADCPCGNGRWWPQLSRRANHIVGLDISPGMLRYARKEIGNLNVKIDICQGNAEKLPLPDSSVDYVFSYALTKHLPIPNQYQVLSEFSRISTFGVICSFGIFSHITYEFWRRRRLEESYPIFIEELQWMAEAANLTIRQRRKCTTPIGVEHIVLFDKNE